MLTTKYLENHVVMPNGNSVFSLTWPASMHIYWNKRKRLHKKLPQDWFWEGGGGGSATAPPQGNTKIAFSSKSAENDLLIGNLQ